MIVDRLLDKYQAILFYRSPAARVLSAVDPGFETPESKARLKELAGPFLNDFKAAHPRIQWLRMNDRLASACDVGVVAVFILVAGFPFWPWSGVLAVSIVAIGLTVIGARQLHQMPGCSERLERFEDEIPRYIEWGVTAFLGVLAVMGFLELLRETRPVGIVVELGCVAAFAGFVGAQLWRSFYRWFVDLLFFVVSLTLQASLVFLVIWSIGYPRDFLTQASSAIIISLAYRFGMRVRWLFAFMEPHEDQRAGSLGSARWATPDHLLENFLLYETEPKKFYPGFILGDFSRGRARSTLCYTGKRHLLTVAPTRSGKGVSAIIPNLLHYDGSVFVIDPKGENARITAFRRGRLPGDGPDKAPEMLQDVYLIDPWNIVAPAVHATAARVNPLDWIKADDPDAGENAFLLADALVPSGAQGDAKFWDDEAKALLTGIILYVATAPSESERRHLGRVRDILNLGENDLRDLLSAMFRHPSPIVSSTAARTASKEPKLRANVLASAQSHTHFLDSPRIRESLSRSDLNFEDMKTKKMSVFLILPADRLQTFDRWLRLLLQQALTVNARNLHTTPSRSVLFMLDEMPSLGRLTMVEQAYSLMAGFGIQLWGIVQDLSQLHSTYGDGWQTFVANSGVIQYFGSRDKMTAEYFSSLCGVTTVRTFSFSSAISSAINMARSLTFPSSGPGSSTSGTTESTSDTATHTTTESQRQLAFPDELMVLKGDDQLIFIENLDPIRAKKIVWHTDPRFDYLGLNEEKDSFMRVLREAELDRFHGRINLAPPETGISEETPTAVMSGRDEASGHDPATARG